MASSPSSPLDPLGPDERSGPRCWVLAVEKRPRPAINLWDIGRDRCERLDHASGDGARCASWALAAVADFDAMKAVVSTYEPGLQLWDLRMLGRPVAVAPPKTVATHGTTLRVSRLGGERPRAALGTRSGNLHLFDASGEGGTLLQAMRLCGHVEEVRWTSFCWDTEESKQVRAASLGADGEVYFWDFKWQPGIAGMHRTQSVELAEAAVTSPQASDVAASPDSPRLGADGDVSPYRSRPTLGKGIKPRSLPCEGTGSRSRAVAFQSREGEDMVCAVTGATDGTLSVWLQGDSDQAEMQQADYGRLSGHTDQVSAICADFEAGVVLSGSLDRTIRVWVLEECCQGSYVDMEGPLEGHTASIRMLISDPVRGRAVSGAEDRTLRIWDLGFSGSGFCSRGAGRCLGVLDVPAGASIRETLACFSCNRAAAVTRDGSLCVWDLERLEKIAQVDSHPGALFAVQLGGSCSHGCAGEAGSSVNPAVAAKAAMGLRPRAEGAWTGGIGWSTSFW